MNPIYYEVKMLKVKSQTGHINKLTTQYLENPLHDRLQTLYAGTS
jgi:hypothetical protein